MTHNEIRRLRIVVSDEETGEEVATASGVETLILLATPDTLNNHEVRHIFMGDVERSFELLFDVLRDVADTVERGTVFDLSDALDDHLLMEVTEELTLH
jgi:hypothetical protein